MLWVRNSLLPNLQSSQQTLVSQFKWTVFFFLPPQLPGTGEPKRGPTVLGALMAEGNRIWASPPYLSKKNPKTKPYSDFHHFYQYVRVHVTSLKSRPEESSSGPHRNFSITGSSRAGQDQGSGTSLLLLQDPQKKTHHTKSKSMVAQIHQCKKKAVKDVHHTLWSLKNRSISSLSPPLLLTSRWRNWSTGLSLWNIWLPCCGEPKRQWKVYQLIKNAKKTKRGVDLQTVVFFFNLGREENKFLRWDVVLLNHHWRICERDEVLIQWRDNFGYFHFFYGTECPWVTVYIWGHLF